MKKNIIMKENTIKNKVLVSFEGVTKSFKNSIVMNCSFSRGKPILFVAEVG